MFNESYGGEFIPQREQVLNFHRILIGDRRSDNTQQESGQNEKVRARPAGPQGDGGEPALTSESIDKQAGVTDWWSDALLDKFPFLPSQKARASMHSRLPDLANSEIKKVGTNDILCKKGHSLSIAKLIDQLRDDKFKVRESAAHKLSQLPEAIFQMEEKLIELKGKRIGDDLEQKTAIRHILSSHNARALLRLEKDVLNDDRVTRELAYEKLAKKTGQFTAMVPKLRERQEQIEMERIAYEQSSLLIKLVPAFARITDRSSDQYINIQRAIDELVNRCDGVELDRAGRIKKVSKNGFNMEVSYDGNRIVRLRSEWMEESREAKLGKVIPDAPQNGPIQRSLNVDVNGNALRVWSSGPGKCIDADIVLDGRFVPAIYFAKDGTLEIHSTSGRQTFETGFGQSNPAALKYIVG